MEHRLVCFSIPFSYPCSRTDSNSVDVAPEILQTGNRRKYTRAVDVWSLGVVLYICLCGFPPFSDELRTPENPYSLSQQIRMGKFDYPSPYWDSIGDLALDLIDRMLTVDVDARISIDECLEHPWLTGQAIAGTNNSADNSQATVTSNGAGYAAKSQDSMQSLSSHLRNLDFSKRKPARERTLLSSINDIKISKIVEVPETADVPGTQQAVKVFEKNVEGKRCYDTQGKTIHMEEQSQAPDADGNANVVKKNKADGVNGKKNEAEDKPDAKRAVGEFMEMGGKGDPELFGNEKGSRYTRAEVP